MFTYVVRAMRPNKYTHVYRAKMSAIAMYVAGVPIKQVVHFLHCKPNSITLAVRGWSPTSFEPASVMEFSFYCFAAEQVGTVRNLANRQRTVFVVSVYTFMILCC